VSSSSTLMLMPALLATVAGCRSSRGNDQLPFVQFSSDQPAARVVTITTRGNYSPPCVTISLGETVEWDNPVGGPINVTSGAVRGKAPELYSPSLVGSAAKWRHTFNTAGRIDYFDQGSAGGGAVDPYYGTRTPGTGAAGAQGTVCARNADGSGCAQLCCIKGGDPAQCGAGGHCEVPADPEIAFGFCAGGATSAPLDASTTD
jgi:plastocyanin